MIRHLGRVRIEIECADIPALIERFTARKIMLYDVKIMDNLTARLSVSLSKLWVVKQIVEKSGGRLTTVQNSALRSIGSVCKKRWMIILLSVVILFLTIWIPTRVWFFKVSGNTSVSEYEIYEVLWNHGIAFGDKRSQLNSEAIKNLLLDEIPELDWAGITTQGCVAWINVKEKNTVNKDHSAKQISSIIAGSDGVIESIVVTKGTQLCKPGQVVKKGQILISGFQDCGMVIQATEAQGEVFARTIRWKTAVTPVPSYVRAQKQETKINYGLQIGKKFINFKNNSGISYPSCVKMYERKCLTLPGGFQLPIWIHKQESICYDYDTVNVSPEENDWLPIAMEHYLLSDMRAGSILQKNYDTQVYENCYLLNGLFVCREEIGKRKIEEILNQNV